VNRVEVGIDPFYINSRFTPKERCTLKELILSGGPIGRRRCVKYLQYGTPYPGNRRFIFEMCDTLISDPRVRWPAVFALGDYAKSHPKELWPLVLKWGSVRSRDIRDGVRCCILEHILEYHFREFFSKAARRAERDARFAYTLQGIYKFGEAAKPRNAALYDGLMARLGKPVKRSPPTH
jgi:hypothetical protein